jgi:hypothetical protein
MENPTSLTQIIRHFNNQLRQTEAAVRREHKEEVKSSIDQVAADEFAKLNGTSTPEDYVSAQTAIKIAQTTLKAGSAAALTAKLEAAREANAATMIEYQQNLVAAVLAPVAPPVNVEAKSNRVSLPNS